MSQGTLGRQGSIRTRITDSNEMTVVNLLSGTSYQTIPRIGASEFRIKILASISKLGSKDLAKTGAAEMLGFIESLDALEPTPKDPQLVPIVMVRFTPPSLVFPNPSTLQSFVLITRNFVPFSLTTLSHHKVRSHETRLPFWK